jgi:hypothetical protein
MSGWGYKINYAASIRDDEARIAHLTSHVCILIARELLPEAQLAYPTFTNWSVYFIITHKVDGVLERAARLGLTREDVRAWAYVVSDDRSALWDVLGDTQKGDHTRGRVIDDRFDLYAFDVLSETDRRKALSKARASLARHKRNAEKFA